MCVNTPYLRHLAERVGLCCLRRQRPSAPACRRCPPRPRPPPPRPRRAWPSSMRKGLCRRRCHGFLQAAGTWERAAVYEKRPSMPVQALKRCCRQRWLRARWRGARATARCSWSLGCCSCCTDSSGNAQAGHHVTGLAPEAVQPSSPSLCMPKATGNLSTKLQHPRLHGSFPSVPKKKCGASQPALLLFRTIVGRAPRRPTHSPHSKT